MPDHAAVVSGDIQICQGAKVTLHFSLHLCDGAMADGASDGGAVACVVEASAEEGAKDGVGKDVKVGAEVDSNYGKNPATFVVGDGNLLPGFEATLIGARAGDHICAVLSPERAFGQINPDNVQRFPRQRFARLLANTTDPVEPGMVLAFTDSGGNEIPGVLKQIGELSVVIDFNHPLSGREILFTADILSVLAPGVQSVSIQG